MTAGPPDGAAAARDGATGPRDAAAQPAQPSAGRSGHVVVAPDKFKGTLTAPQVAAHVAAGLRRGCPGVRVVTLPVADGGDGTVDSAVAAGYRRVQAVVAGPTGEPVSAAFAIHGAAAIIEAAEACGLRRLPGGTPAPLTATSHGVGELIIAAVRAGARRIVLGLGGVACTDGGAGLVQALGGRLLDREGAPLPPGGAALRELDRLDLGGFWARGAVTAPARPGVIAACDVDNRLLGPGGAAAVYAPQKGATPHDVAILEDGIAHWADVAEHALGHRYRDLPGSGAAGGLGFAALAFLGASMRRGIDVLLERLDFARQIQGARLVVTGEGSLDAQTLRGKAPAGVARAAAAAGVPVAAVAGVATLGGGDLRRLGVAAVYTLASIQPDLRRCMTDPGPLVEDLAERLAHDWLCAAAEPAQAEGAQPP
ncbi:MAG TPA: glycerate kinase [Streptosporangiaceae bacterium]|nr:glycerate kinase [Streptosporangiaceae bacterium]